jgi:3-phenylpropionate/cinnamic acid dioxygenase small subunit
VPVAGVSEAERRAVVDFLHREARLADEARYAEWEALWTDDGVYWVPATTDPAADPQRQISHVYDNRARISTRVKLLQSGYRPSQDPPSPMRRLISNVEVRRAENGELVAESNFLLAELSVQARHELHLWSGRAIHRLRHVDGALRMSGKTVVLINAAEPLPNLSFLI